MEWLLLSCGFFLILGTGFFVAVEFSLIALDQNTVQIQADKGDKRAIPLLKNLKSLSTQLSSCQLGTTITTLLTGYLMEPALKKIFVKFFYFLGLNKLENQGISTIASLIMITFLSMLFGELVPKNLAIALPMQIGKLFSPAQIVFTNIFKPVIFLFNKIANTILRILHINIKEEISGARTSEELFSIIKFSAKEGTIDFRTAKFLSRTLKFSTSTAADIMTPRVKLIALESNQSVEDLVKLANKTGHSRFPVLGESADEIRGVVHIKNAITIPIGMRSKVLASSLMKEVLEVPETIKLDLLLTKLKKSNFQLTVVLDEYGGTAGIATLEDCVEEIVGEVSDEHDKSIPTISKMHNGDWLIPAISHSHEITEYIKNFNIDPTGRADFETLGGYIMEKLERVPHVGDVIYTKAGKLTIISMDNKRVDQVQLTPYYNN